MTAIVAGTAAGAAVIAAAILIGRPAPSRPAAGPAHQRLAVPATHSLAPARGALFGAWVQPVQYGLPGSETAVTGFEHAIGRKLAINQLYVPWGAPMPLALARWDVQNGRIPMISWSGARTDRITSGAYDTQIRARAIALRELRGPVMLRWFAEMDDAPNRAAAVSPASFVAAWQHLHEIFTTVGATNVRWVWCPDASAFAAGKAQKYYPGRSFVDWAGADGYNWAPERPNVKWRSFATIFAAFYRWGVPAGVPLLIGEYGAVEGPPGAKAGWFRQADQQLRSQFPGIHAVVYFNSDHVNFGQHFNWRVTTSPSALAAFRAFAGDPYFGVRPVT